MPDSSPHGEAVPQSRRAAREAAARLAATGETPTARESAPTTPQRPQADQPTADATLTWESLITGSTPVVNDAGASPATADEQPRNGFQPVPLRSPRPAQPVEADSSDDDAWIFAAAGAGPAIPYSRSAATSAAAPASAIGRTAAPPHEPTDVPPLSAGTLEDLFRGSSSTEDIGHVPPPRTRSAGASAAGSPSVSCS